jgi:hypothetical protein
MRFLAAFCLFATIPVHGVSPGDDGARNVALIREYAELGRRGEYEKQATCWSSDAVNNGRPMQPAMIRPSSRTSTVRSRTTDPKWSRPSPRATSS